MKPPKLAEPDKPTKSPAWLRQIVGLFETVENLQPDPEFLIGDLPVWVNNVAREFTKSIFPTAHLRVATAWEPGEVGAIIGQQVAYWHHVGDWMASLAKRSESEEERRNQEQIWEYFKRLFGPDIQERVAEFFRALADDVLPAFTHAVSAALSIAIQQDYVPANRFFAAFSKALGRKPSRGSGIGRTNTTIYVVMLTNWRQVEELGSIPALHEFLRKHIFLTSQVVGDLKRIEKICERMQFSYREIAERKLRASDPDMTT
jgi:hypothetical protein